MCANVCILKNGNIKVKKKRIFSFLVTCISNYKVGTSPLSGSDRNHIRLWIGCEITGLVIRHQWFLYKNTVPRHAPRYKLSNSNSAYRAFIRRRRNLFVTDSVINHSLTSPSSSRSSRRFYRYNHIHRSDAQKPGRSGNSCSIRRPPAESCSLPNR